MTTTERSFFARAVPSAAERRFTAAMFFWAATCVALAFLVERMMPEDWPSGVRVVAYLWPVIPIVGTLVAKLNWLMSESDEYQRMLVTRAFLWAMAVALAAITGWSSLAEHSVVPPLSAPFIIAILWLASAFTRVYVQWKNR